MTRDEALQKACDATAKAEEVLAGGGADRTLVTAGLDEAVKASRAAGWLDVARSWRDAAALLG